MNKRSTVGFNPSQSNVLGSSFYEETVSRPGVSSHEVQQIRQVFDMFDPKGTGFVRPQQLQASLQSLGSEAINQPIYKMISDLVNEGTEQIEFQDFLDLMTARISAKDTKADLHTIFNLFDQQNKGYISMKNLKRVVRDLGQKINDSQLHEMIEKADQDGDGLVSEQQFYNIMTNKISKQ